MPKVKKVSLSVIGSKKVKMVSPDAVGPDGLMDHERSIITASKITLPKGYLSPSAIEQYLRCPHQYYRRYVLGEKTPPAVAMVEGTCHHAALKTNNERKKKTHSDMKPKDMFDVFEAEWNHQKMDIEDWEGEKSDAVVSRGKSLIHSYMKSFAPKLQPHKIEEKVEGMIGPVGVLGYIDVAGMVGDRPTVGDYKTVARVKSENELKSSIQLSFYAWMEAQGGDEDFDVGYINLLKNSGRIEPQFVKYERGRVLWMRYVTLSVANAISLGSFPMTTPDNWACSARFCGFWSKCRGRFCK